MKKKTKKSDSYIITGVAGFIGRRFLDNLDKNKVLGVYHQTPPPKNSSKLTTYVRRDLTKPMTLKSDANIVIHAAAYAHIDRCELEKNLGQDSLAWQVNVVGTQNIINYCKENSKTLVLLSTECVFSGEKDSYKETDTKEPKNWYGQTKSIAEDLVLNSGLKRFLIVRGVVAYGQGGLGSNMVQGIVNNLIYKGKTNAVTDQKIAFTHIDDLTEGTIALLDVGAKGIYHIAGSQIASPYELAQKVCKKLNVPTNKVNPVTLKQFFGPIESNLRLKNSVLDSQKFRQATGRKTLSLDQGIEKTFLW